MSTAVFLWATFFARAALATDFTATNFSVLDPVLSGGGGYATSSNFQLWSAIAQSAIGTSTATSFELRGGFLYFPTPTPTPTPTLTPTPSATAAPNTGRGSYLAPLPPLLEIIRPLQPRVPEPLVSIPDLVGRPCNRRSDFNCDGKVDLHDFSIFIHKPLRVNPIALSVVLSDWTEALPALLRAESAVAYEPFDRETSEERRAYPGGREGLASAGEAFRSGTTSSAASEVSVERKGFFRTLWDILRAIGRFLLNVLQFVKRLIW